MKRHTQLLVVGVGVLSFIVIGGASAQRSEDPNALLERAQRSRLSDAEVNQLAAADRRIFVTALDRLSKSRLAAEVGSRLEPGFNLGLAVDTDTFANNVVRVMEASPAKATEVILGRLDPKIVSTFKLSSPDFRKLDAFAIKSLVTIDMLQRVSARGFDERAQNWVYSLTDSKKLNAALSRAGYGESQRRAAFVPVLLAALVAEAVWELGKHLLGGAIINRDVFLADSNGKLRPIRLDLLSPATKRKLKLTLLDRGATGEIIQ
jgi:hypothetical protein